LNTLKVREVIDTAINCGAEGFLFTTHPFTYGVLKGMSKLREIPNFGLYPLLPYVQSYVRMANEKGTLGLAKQVLLSLSWRSRAKALTSGGLSMATLDPERLLNTYVDTELDILFRHAPRASLRSVFLHEVLTDLAVSFDAHQLIRGYANHVLNNFKVRPGFATRNFPKFISFIMKSGLKLNEIIVLTPFNSIGFQMNPSKEACEQTLDQLPDANVIAMSVLAAGFLDPSDAFQYLHNHPLKSFVVGASTQAHVRETFLQMRKILG